MSKTKKKVEQKTLKPIEQFRQDVKKQLEAVNAHCKVIQDNWNGIDLDVDAAIEGLGGVANGIEEIFDNVEKDYDKLDERCEELLQEAKDIQSQVDLLESKQIPFEEVQTMVGDLKYHTTNLLDSQTLDLFTQCLVEIRPAALQNALENILRNGTTNR